MKLCPQCDARHADSVSRCGCGASLTARFTANPFQAPANAAPAATGVPIHFYVIPIGLLAMEAVGLIAAGRIQGAGIVRMALMAVLAYFLLQGSAIALKVTRVLLAIGVALVVLMLWLVPARPGAANPLAVFYAPLAFYGYCVAMLVGHQRLKDCYR